MSSFLIFSFTILLLLSTLPNVHSHNEFFPDWTNCANNSELEFIDFYLDHQPNRKHIVNMLTFCAGSGKTIPVGGVNVVIQNNNNTLLFNETYPSLIGARFTNGVFNHCLQVPILEFPIKGDYNLSLTVLNATDQTPLSCLEATWSVKGPKEILTE